MIKVVINSNISKSMIFSFLKMYIETIKCNIGKIELDKVNC